MKRVSSKGNCAAIEGSFFAPPPANGAAATIYFHPIGHTDATADAKKYEVTTRDAGLITTDLATGVVIEGIHTRGSLQNDGTAVVNGTGSYIKNCLFEDGSKHTMFITDNCVVEDCTALKGEGIDSYFVYFYTNGGSSTGTTFRRCNAIGGYAYGEEQTKYATTIGFFCHASTGTLTTVTYEDCYAENLIGGFGGDALTVNIVKCKTHFVAVAGSSFSSSLQAIVNIRQCFFDQRSPQDYQKADNDARPLLELSTGTNNVEGNVFIVDLTRYGNIICSHQDNTTINFRKNTLVAQSGAAGFGALLKNGTGQVLATGNIFYGFSNIYDSRTNNSVIVADGNAYFRMTGDITFKNRISTYPAYPHWRAGGQDATGINANPNFTSNIATWTKVGNAGISNAAVKAIQAGATYY